MLSIPIHDNLYRYIFLKQRKLKKIYEFNKHEINLKDQKKNKIM